MTTLPNSKPGNAMNVASSGTLLEVRNLTKHFPVPSGLLRRAKRHVRAVDGVSFALNRGETLCIVGESGCGKSTVGKLAMRLMEPTAGEIILEGQDITALSRAEMRLARQQIQMVFQDPFACLNPRLTAGQIVAEPLENFGMFPGAARREKVAELFRKVGLRPEGIDKLPHEFSGGQRQRIGIARALALGPRTIIADEPVSALDVSVQAQVLNLMKDLQEELGLSYLFISHDLGVVEYIAHRVVVMYLGRVVEIGGRDAIFDTPRHPYTRALMSAAPVPDPRNKAKRMILQGDVPSPMNPPPGCRFHTRCPFAFDRCRREEPVLRDVGVGQQMACHLDEGAV
ncbi:ABC transporter ATP-binding protein [Microvirga sp. 17 mud 1-3]|uniref:ABC transporter ATP-binding protein n=1 Tax=Microvirga sp. 17 mud 1-3 TaxID=2082949 RepID=UPI0026D6B97B|nr:dipeptide ABC transporter ATP-binding protein [Microvirga sp. 17 mud 1-3]